MDSLTYHYTTGSNRLDHVNDAIADTNYPDDIDDQGSGNYSYDPIGNLERDNQDSLMYLWNVYGKLAEVQIGRINEEAIVDYHYDPMGNRVEKYFDHRSGSWDADHLFHVRDAQGNIMATYSWSNFETEYKLTELNIYGSSRLGVMNVDTMIFDYTTHSPAPFYSAWVGRKQYELTNHLGNVLSTITDKKILFDNDNDGLADWSLPEISTANDYYPFGMLMPGRKFESSGSYRYGFQGFENESGVKGNGELVAFGDFGFDTRLGRRMTGDQHSGKYPFNSPFVGFNDNPLIFKDPDGRDVYLIIWYSANGEIGHAGIAVDNYVAVTEKVKQNGKWVTKTTLKPDGTVTYYDFWPTSAGKKNFDENQTGIVNKKDGFSIDYIKTHDLGFGEKRPPEGVIRLSADQKETESVHAYAEDKFNTQTSKEIKYNGATFNCSSFSLDCLSQLYSFKPGFGVENINTEGNKWLFIPDANTNSVTPNFLFKSVSDLVTQSPKKGTVEKRDTKKEGLDFVNAVTNGHATDKTPGK